MSRYECPGCGYIYDENLGDEHEGFLPGTRWQQIPDNWACPDCAVRDKFDFIPKTSAVDDAATGHRSGSRSALG
ncbi:MAG: rubredoxin [Nevskiaceae bacterium]|nr:MAG: rubredoxin [Nevskiaceae bacterium]TBR74243.1 MAG: rubredoxin [Nevskiaceae bacterium]